MTTTPHYYHLRPYNPTREADRTSLDEICEHVYGGSDYLPKMAEGYASDSSCSFLALTIPVTNIDAGADTDAGAGADVDVGVTTDDRIIAVANYKRLPSQNSAWIEAVRTHPSYRNRGLATIMLRSIVDVALSEENTKIKEEKKEEDYTVQQYLSREEMTGHGTNLPPPPPPPPPPNTRKLTCTIQSNKGMIRALTKSGFTQCNTIPTLQFSTLTNLPGWKYNCQTKDHPQSLLHALDLMHLVSPTAKDAVSSSSSSSSSLWTVLSNEQKLLECLQLCKEEGNCSGYLPGLYEYIIPGPNRLDLRTSLHSGLVLALESSDVGSGGCSSGSTSDSTTATTNTTTSTLGRAILVLTQDERISSLKSKWVCSIVAYTRHAFEAALWMAHSDTIARRMKHHTSHGCRHYVTGVEDEKKLEEEEGIEVVSQQQFCLVFDDAVPLEEGTLANALPRVTDECIVFSYAGGHS